MRAGRAARFAILAAGLAGGAAGASPADLAGCRPLHYQITITPEFGTATFSGEVTIDLQVDKPTSRLTLDAVGLEIVDASIAVPGGRERRPAAAVDAAAGQVTFTLAPPLQPGPAKLRIEYDGRLGNEVRGFYMARVRGRPYLFSQMEAIGARRAFPCVDDPAVKASFALSAVVPAGLTAISNGPPVSDTPGPKAGTHTLRFGTTPRMSTYLVALAVGAFECLEGSAESVPLRVCAIPERKDLGRFALDAAERAFAFDSRYFGFRYPFRKLDLVAVPGGFPGAMENAGAIFFDDGLVEDPDRADPSSLAEEASVLSHEIAHLWVGDLVTMAAWDDLWLNEGFASWMTAKPIEAWKPEWQAGLDDIESTSRVMRLDTLRSARPVRAPVSAADEIEESFDPFAYDKGAAIVRMIEAWIGPEAFRQAIAGFIHAHAFGSVTTGDLAAGLQEATGRPVSAVLSSFVSSAGVPVVHVESSCEGGETVVTAALRRLRSEAAPEGEPGASWTIPIGLRGLGDGATRPAPVTELLTAPRQTFRLEGCFPAVFANVDAAGYYFTSYTSAAVARLAASARSQLSEAERLRLLDDAWDLARAGDQPIGDYLAIAAGLAADRTPQIAEAIDRQLVFARNHFVAGPEHAWFEAWISRVFSPVLKDLGWKPDAADGDGRTRLRRAVVDLLGRAGRDGTVLETARSAAESHLAGRGQVGPSSMPLVVRLAAVAAGATLLPRLRGLDEREVLATTADAEFVVSILAQTARSGGGREPWPDRLAAALENPAAQSLAWKLAVSRWPEVASGYAKQDAVAGLLGAAGALCDGESRESVRQFFADKTSAIPRTLRLTVDRIDACRDARLRVGAPLAAWLKAAAAPTPPGIR